MGLDLRTVKADKGHRTSLKWEHMGHMRKKASGRRMHWRMRRKESTSDSEMAIEEQSEADAIRLLPVSYGECMANISFAMKERFAAASTRNQAAKFVLQI